MSDSDVVHELAHIMHKDGPLSDMQKLAVQRARDEIERLRHERVNLALEIQMLRDTLHAEALEEAAMICEQRAQAVPTDKADSAARRYEARMCANAIRALASPPEPAAHE